jgi:hypothetical protein
MLYHSTCRVLVAMSSLKTTQSIHGNRRSPQIASRDDFRDSPQAIPAARLTHINLQALPYRPSGNIRCKLNNTKEKPLRLSVSASKSPSPGSPSNHEIPNDPNPISGHSTTPRRAQSATPAPPPRRLPSIATPSAPPSSPPPNCTYSINSSILSQFGSFRVRCLKSWSLLQANPR